MSPKSRFESGVGSSSETMHSTDFARKYFASASPRRSQLSDYNRSIGERRRRGDLSENVSSGDCLRCARTIARPSHTEGLLRAETAPGGKIRSAAHLRRFAVAIRYVPNPSIPIAGAGTNPPILTARAPQEGVFPGLPSTASPAGRARMACIKWYQIDNFLPKREDRRSLISMPDRTPVPSGAMILSLPRPSRAAGRLDASDSLVAGGRPFSGAHGERRRVKIKLAQLPGRPAARLHHHPIARRKTGVFRRPIGWVPPRSRDRGRRSVVGFPPSRISAGDGWRGVLPETCKWRRISLKTLETEAEMADPAPSSNHQKPANLQSRATSPRRPEDIQMSRVSRGEGGRRGRRRRPEGGHRSHLAASASNAPVSFSMCSHWSTKSLSAGSGAIQ